MALTLETSIPCAALAAQAAELCNCDLRFPLRRDCKATSALPPALRGSLTCAPTDLLRSPAASDASFLQRRSVLAIHSLIVLCLVAPLAFADLGRAPFLSSPSLPAPQMQFSSLLFLT